MRERDGSNREPIWGRLCALLSGAALLVGCWKPPEIAMAPERGLVWIFPGIEGGEWTVEQAYHALRDANIAADIRVYNWWRLNPLANLSDYEQNRQRAAEVAEELAEYRAEHPHGTIDLIGYSGGGGLALFVAEALPASVRLRNVVLVHAAVSPEYNLCPALERIDGRLVNLYSPLDSLVLRVGTRIFGTMDRRRVPAAGSVGFEIDKAVPCESLRRRLVQHSWTQEARETGHRGNHAGKGEYEWNLRYVAPYVAAGGGHSNAASGADWPGRAR